MPTTPKVSTKTFLYKLYRLLETKPFVVNFRKLKKNRGYCYDNKKLIELDPRDSILSTFLHEAIHYMYPKWEEDEAAWHEEYYVNKLSMRQLKNILKRLINVL